MDEQEPKRIGGWLDSDISASKRRLRLLLLLGLPTLAASVVLVLLGIPWWLVAGFLAVVALVMILES